MIWMSTRWTDERAHYHYAVSSSRTREPSCSNLSVIIAVKPFYANENLLTTEKSGLYLFNITTSLIEPCYYIRTCFDSLIVIVAAELSY
jgi:hypothetical protein